MVTALVVGVIGAVLLWVGIIGRSTTYISGSDPMSHVPMCEWCGEHEVGSIDGGTDRWCSFECADAACFELGDDDGQPSEQDEWLSFDSDC